MHPGEDDEKGEEEKNGGKMEEENQVYNQRKTQEKIIGRETTNA